MSMTNCSECKAQVSTEAKACPNCGAPVPKGWTVGKIVLAILFVAFVVSLATKPTADNDPEAEGRALAESRVKEERFSRVVSATSAIKRSLRDPESVVWEAVWTDERAQVICIRYRAKNGFGGYNKESVVFANNEASAAAEAWALVCPKATTDMVYAANAVK